MALDNYMEERIENYLTNKLSGADRAAFEKEIAANPSLKEEVEHQKLLMGAIIRARKDELKEYIRLNTVEATRERNAGPFWMSIAAALVLAVGAGFYVYFKQQRGANINTVAMKTAPAPEQKNSAPNPETSAQSPAEKFKVQLEKPLPPKTDESRDEPAKAESPVYAGESKNPEPKINKDTSSYLSNYKEPDNRLSETRLATQGSFSQKTNIDSYNFNYRVSPKKINKSSKNKKSKSITLADSIKEDVLLKDSIFYAGDISSAWEMDKSRNSNNTLNTISNVKVSYWKSAINFKGYQYHRKKLSLYGINPSSNIRLKFYNSNLYMKLNGNIYLIKDDNYNYYDFSKPVEDKKLIEEFEKN
jgi:hypothetical protein